MEGTLAVSLVIALLTIFIVYRTAVVVPQQSAYVVERLGRYHQTMNAGFHILVPFVDALRYRHTLKETAHDIAAQVCITRDNVQVGVDGVLYLKVLNPERASYGISDYLFAITQLAQTTLRSEVGKIDLDRTFEERSTINIAVVGELDKASEAWGVKVLRYEIKNIQPPADVLAAMEKQMRAEREKRAVILTSEGQRDAAINSAGRRKAAGHQGVGSQSPAADERSRGPGAGDPGRRHRDRRGDPARRRGDRDRGGHGSGSAARRRTVRGAVRQPRKVDDFGDRAGHRVGPGGDGGRRHESVRIDAGSSRPDSCAEPARALSAGDVTPRL
jgi:regulator of protease activity HflC (stomatin/prohibitin superfamily)